MNSNLFFSLVVCVFLFVDGLDDVGFPTLSRNKIEKICSDYKKNLPLGLSRKEMDEFLEQRVIHEIILQKRYEKKLNNKNFGITDGQKIDINTNSEVGENGQLFKEAAFGTDSSTSANLFSFFLDQDNNRVSDSDFNQLSTLLTISANLGRKHLKKKGEKIESNILRSLEDDSLELGACEDEIGAVYGRLIKFFRLAQAGTESSSQKPQANLAKGEGFSSKKSFDVPESNSTSIKTTYGIKSGGYLLHSDNIATGEASSTVRSELTDIQTHNSYKNSKIKINRLALSPFSPFRISSSMDSSN